MPSRGLRLSLLAAASVVLCATSLWLYSRRTEPARPVSSATVTPAPVTSPVLARLAKFEPPHYEIQAMRGSSGSRNKRFRQAMQSYAGANFEAAVTDLDRFLVSDPDYTPARFYAGFAKLLTHNPDSAISDFNQVLAAKDSDFTEEAEWGIANAALLKNDAPLAREYLMKVAQKGGLFSQPAKQLLVKIESLSQPSPQPR